MKYVMFELDLGGSLRQKIPVIFPSFLVHEIVARAFEQALAEHDIAAEPVSAGEVSVFGPGVRCGGSSETMDLSSDPKDAEIVAFYDYVHGVVDAG